MYPSKFSKFSMGYGVLCFFGGFIICLVTDTIKPTMEMLFLGAIFSGVFAIWIKDEDSWKT